MTSRRFPPPWTIKKLAECFIVRDKLAQHIIETKSAAFDPAMLEDHYRRCPRLQRQWRPPAKTSLT
jgi:hypothetical protein